ASLLSIVSRPWVRLSGEDGFRLFDWITAPQERSRHESDDLRDGRRATRAGADYWRTILARLQSAACQRLHSELLLSLFEHGFLRSVQQLASLRPAISRFPASCLHKRSRVFLRPKSARLFHGRALRSKKLEIRNPKQIRICFGFRILVVRFFPLSGLVVSVKQRKLAAELGLAAWAERPPRRWIPVTHVEVLVDEWIARAAEE